VRRVPRLLSASEAAALIGDGQTVASTGFSMIGVAEALYRAIEARFLAEGHPRDLTLVHSAGQSDRANGMQHWAQPGLLARIIGSHWGLAPKMAELIAADGLACHCLPQGQLTHLYRAIAGGQPGLVSTIGLHTFVDPRREGARVNARAMAEPSLVELVTLSGQEALWYKSFPIHVAIVRGTVADTAGNVIADEEPLRLEVLTLAQAARNSGGIVICQVKRLVAPGTLPPLQISIPGMLVDVLVVAESPEETHRQSSSWAFYAPLITAGGGRAAPAAVSADVPGAPLDERTLIGRRAALELFPGALVNLGTGIPGDTVGHVAAAEGVAEQIVLSIESGTAGGVPAGGGDFGVALYPDSIIGHAEQFDFYNGGAVDLCYMGAGEIDRAGNVNVSKLGGRMTGCGGFIDITQPARKVVFCATFSSGGLRVATGDGELRVLQEGRYPKFVRDVAQVTFSAEESLRRRQPVLYVTERAVFRLTAEGLRLIEIAPGIDLQHDVLDRLPFTPIVADPLLRMDPATFRPGRMGLLRERFGGAGGPGEWGPGDESPG
jgi:propionate CoA-transferase